MRWFEFFCTIFSILSGFWLVSQKLTKIEVAITKKVGYRECKEQREECPCHREIAKLWQEVDKNHPRKK